MSETACPMCELNDVLKYPKKWECVTCGHEWKPLAGPDAPSGRASSRPPRAMTLCNPPGPDLGATS